MELHGQTPGQRTGENAVAVSSRLGRAGDAAGRKLHELSGAESGMVTSGAAGAIGSGIGSGFPGGEACTGIARQPQVTSQLTTNMLIGSAVCQTPAIFSMVVSNQ